MAKLFGTDGIRGIVNEDLNAILALKIGSSVAKVLKNELKKDKLTLLIGGDTRISKDMLTSSVAAGVLSEGCDVISLGVLPTPAISYLVKEYNVSGGFTGRKNYYKINSKNSDWKEVCKELTTIYKIKTNLSYEWLYDISHSKFTVV